MCAAGALRPFIKISRRFRVHQFSSEPGLSSESIMTLKQLYKVNQCNFYTKHYMIFIVHYLKKNKKKKERTIKQGHNDAFKM